MSLIDGMGDVSPVHDRAPKLHALEEATLRFVRKNMALTTRGVKLLV
jgi:hypothetical protein